jgi:hypothetical protein
VTSLLGGAESTQRLRLLQGAAGSAADRKGRDVAVRVKMAKDRESSYLDPVSTWTPPENPHLTVIVDAARHLVRVTRTPIPLKGEADIDVMVRGARARLDLAGRGTSALLVDLRAALLSDETNYAGAMQKLRAEITRGFPRCAFLVTTSVGRIQILRFLREERINAPVFSDEAEALRSLGVGP